MKNEIEYANKMIDIALLAGEIMIECNAESYRVEDTMKYILSSTDYESCESYAMATGIFVSLSDSKYKTITKIKRVKKRNTNLNKIYQVNIISRDLVSKKIDADYAYEKLNNMSDVQYNSFVKNISLSIMCGAYVALFNGGLLEMIIGAIGAIALPVTSKIDKKLNVDTFIENVLSLAAAVLIVYGFKYTIFPKMRADIAIIGVMMPAVPGTAITNSIRDTLRGDYNSGIARALEAFVTALSVAIGVAVGLMIIKGVFR